jgi:hypothetical protein
VPHLEVTLYRVYGRKVTPVPHLEVILYRVYGRKVPNVLYIDITKTLGDQSSSRSVHFTARATATAPSTHCIRSRESGPV